MNSLGNKALIDAYMKAIDLKLEQDFIDLLYKEIIRRKINILEVLKEAQVKEFRVS